MSAEISAIAELEASSEFQAICMSIAELEQKLLEQDPGMPEYLRRIHMNLLKHPELVHILQDEQRAVIIDGLMQQTGVMLSAVTASKLKSTTTKRLKAQSADDI